MSFSEIINITISRQTRAVNRRGFGVGMFLGRHSFFTERALAFSNYQEVLDAGIPETSAEALAASDYFGQQVSPTQLVIGRQVPTTVKLATIADVVPVVGTIYTVSVGTETVSPVTYSYTSVGSPTAAIIVDALVTLIQADANIYPALVNATNVGNVLHIAPVTSENIIVKGWNSAALTVSYNSAESLTSALTEILNVNTDWYALSCYSHHTTDIQALAAWVATQKRIYGYSTGDSVCKTTTATCPMGILNANSYDRAFGVFDTEAGTDRDPASSAVTYPEMGWLGVMLPKDPGSATWMFKNISGLTPDNLTTTESTNIRNKKGNTYETFHGQSMVREGQMANGEYIDIIHGADWLQARLEERIYTLMLNTEKIPYTDSGVALIEAEIRAQLTEGVDVGYLTPDFTITVPKVANVSANDKLNRVLPAITFVAVLAGAVHSVTVQGTVTV